MRGQDALCSNHASKVIGSSFPAYQNGLATFLCCFNSSFRGEYGLAHCSTRRCVQAFCNHIVFGLGIKLWMKKLIELFRVNTLNCLFLSDKAFLFHFDSNVKSSLSGTLTNTSLEHPKLTLLDSEFDVAHITEVILENSKYLFEFTTCLFEAFHMLKIRNRAGVTNTCYYVFALSVYQVVAVEFLFTCCRITSKCNTRSRSITLVAENHRLNIYCSAQIIRNLVLLTIQDCTRIIPRAKYCLDSQAKLNVWILRELNFAINDK